jgi:sulfoxide reductase heme-binding subunit YedZ
VIPSYVAVGWNRQKRLYDATLAASVAGYLAVFVLVSVAANPNATVETVLLRALGSCAFLLLSVALSIGPLTRLDSRFLPLLYNRRHLGVATCLVGLAHGAFAIVHFHAFGDAHPLVSLLASNMQFTSLAQFPFQQLGLAALGILFLMAATSHDFWLSVLTPPVWKRLHMLAYAAYALVVAHVAFGPLQTERDPALAAIVAAGACAVSALHLAAAWREAGREVAPASLGELVDAVAVDAIPEGAARIVTIDGERVAIFRYDGKISAVSNVCRHQNGPLGEGRILDGCITCPWHGFQYDPATGSAPPPFAEKVPTYDVRVEQGRVLVRRAPNSPGTYAEPAVTGAMR